MKSMLSGRLVNGRFGGARHPWLRRVAEGAAPSNLMGAREGIRLLAAHELIRPAPFDAALVCRAGVHAIAVRDGGGVGG